MEYCPDKTQTHNTKHRCLNKMKEFLALDYNIDSECSCEENDIELNSIGVSINNLNSKKPFIIPMMNPYK